MHPARSQRRAISRGRSARSASLSAPTSTRPAPAAWHWLVPAMMCHCPITGDQTLTLMRRSGEDRARAPRGSTFDGRGATYCDRGHSLVSLRRPPSCAGSADRPLRAAAVYRAPCLHRNPRCLACAHRVGSKRSDDGVESSCSARRSSNRSNVLRSETSDSRLRTNTSPSGSRAIAHSLDCGQRLVACSRGGSVSGNPQVPGSSPGRRAIAL